MDDAEADLSRSAPRCYGSQSIVPADHVKPVAEIELLHVRVKKFPPSLQLLLVYSTHDAYLYLSVPLRNHSCGS